MKTVKFTEMKKGTKEEYLLLDEYEQSYINGTADTLFSQGICLPSGSNMDDKDMERVIKSIKTFFTK